MNSGLHTLMSNLRHFIDEWYQCAAYLQPKVEAALNGGA